MEQTTWREEILSEMHERGEAWSDVVACTLDDAGLDKPFDGGYGAINGAAFTLWTKRLVYFPVVYDGREWVSSVPREPCEDATDHVGGGSTR